MCVRMFAVGCNQKGREESSSVVDAAAAITIHSPPKRICVRVKRFFVGLFSPSRGAYVCVCALCVYGTKDDDGVVGPSLCVFIFAIIPSPSFSASPLHTISILISRFFRLLSCSFLFCPIRDAQKRFVYFFGSVFFALLAVGGGKKRRRRRVYAGGYESGWIRFFVFGKSHFCSRMRVGLVDSPH